MIKNTILTVTGFGGTGSSAISDIISEFKGIKTFGTSECWLFQDLFGIRDLEYFLTDGNHRSKASFSIKMFEKNIYKKRKIYEVFFGNSFIDRTREFIKNLETVEYRKAYSDFDLIGQTKKTIYRGIIPDLQKFFFSKMHDVNKREPWIPQENKKYSNISKDKFVEETFKYFENLNSENFANFNYVFFDQLVPAHRIEGYLGYFRDIRIIIVDRDPRDLYLLNKLKWKNAPYLCNTGNVEEYINWYKTLRNNLKSDLKLSDVKYINFENLILNYEITLSDIVEHYQLDISNHTMKNKYFNPILSMTGIGLWKLRNEYKSEIGIIEKECSEYLFDV